MNSVEFIILARNKKFVGKNSNFQEEILKFINRTENRSNLIFDQYEGTIIEYKVLNSTNILKVTPTKVMVSFSINRMGPLLNAIE